MTTGNAQGTKTNLLGKGLSFRGGKIELAEWDTVDVRIRIRFPLGSGDNQSIHLADVSFESVDHLYLPMSVPSEPINRVTFGSSVDGKWNVEIEFEDNGIKGEIHCQNIHLIDMWEDPNFDEMSSARTSIFLGTRRIK